MVSPAVRVAGLAGLLSLTLLAPASAMPGAPGSRAATAQPAVPRSPSPSHLDLPAGFQPEGIAIGRRPVAWLGSLADGDIYRLDLRTGTGTVVSQGPGTPSVGLKVDRRGRLFVAGGTAGTGRVVDARTGRVRASYRFTTGSSFVNDVTLSRGTAWFTDSSRAQLYRLTLRPGGGLPAAAATLPLTGAWRQGPGLAANGIVDTPDRRALLVVHTTSGVLYRVSPRTGRARVVDLRGASLTNGDGLLRRGRTLYVARNLFNRVDVVRLGRQGRAGRVVGTLTSPDFDVPTTIAALGRSLYLPNARFTTPPTPMTRYWVTRLRR